MEKEEEKREERRKMNLKLEEYSLTYLGASEGLPIYHYIKVYSKGGWKNHNR